MALITECLRLPKISNFPNSKELILSVNEWTAGMRRTAMGVGKAVAVRAKIGGPWAGSWGSSSMKTRPLWRKLLWIAIFTAVVALSVYFVD